MKAYLMAVTSRDHSLFAQGYLSFSQLDDDIAIVNVDGKEQFFDPGSRYCPYQHLEWKHTTVTGIRQVDGGGTVFAQTPNSSYIASRVQRVADLTMDEHGVVSGTVKMTFIGDPALSWRQRALANDIEDVRHELRTDLEHLLPGGMEVKPIAIDKLEDYEQPLDVSFFIKGAVGSTAGKRLLVPNDIFTASMKPSFPHEKRDIPVYFHYANTTQDAVRIKFPESIKLESAPTGDKFQFQKFALYSLSSDAAPHSVTVHRNFILGEIVFLPKEYADLRTFYSKLETKDQESIVLSSVPGSTPATSTMGN